MRVPDSQPRNRTLEAVAQLQSDQAKWQSRISTGLRVQTPGDDPVAAAQAELARSRQAQLTQEARAGALAASLLSTADGALGQAADLLASAREALVAAQNGAYSASDRASIAQQLRGVRAQLMALANSSDGAGGFVFAGQGSTTAPVQDGASPQFLPAAGEQRIGAGGRFATTVDGRAAFLAVPQGNGVFTTQSAAGNTGTGWIDAGTVARADALTGHQYRITVAGAPGAQTVDIQDLTDNRSVASNLAFTPGSALEVEGQRVVIAGAPAAGDRFELGPAQRHSVFRALDAAIALLEDAGATASQRAEGLQRAHVDADRALDAMLSARTGVGEALRATEWQLAGDAQESLGAAALQSTWRDQDLAQAISQLQSSQSRQEAALKSYASGAQNSLFKFIG